ncbi:MAG: EpsI family protein [Gemmatimonadota bacterium]|nr:EpsI family protein [Gemmatimonadota bacterium]
MTTSRIGVGAILLATLVAFWPTLASFPGTWNASYQEQGFFVGGLVIWLVWRDRRRILRDAGPGLPDLLPLVALVSIAWLFAVVMNVRLVHQLLFTMIATLVALAIFGWSARRIILVTSATFLLAIPFWDAFSPILQRWTTIASGGIAKLGGVEAEIGYSTITISTGTFLVESGCSGINYLMGGLVLGAFYAHLFTDRWQTQLKIVAVAGFMSIVGNWIRVAVLIFLGEATAMQSPYIADHLWQGWAIFTLLMIPTYFLARRIEQKDAARRRAGVGPEVARDGETQGAERDREAAPEEAGAPTVGMAPESPWLDPSPHVRTRAIRAGLVAAVGPILLVLFSVIPRGADLDRDAAVFPVVAPWTMEEAAVGGEPWRPDFKGVDAEARWRIAGGERPVHAARYYFVDQRQGEELIQYNNFVAADSLLVADRIVGPIGPERRFVHEAIVRDADEPRVVWYWYRVAGFDTPFETKAKLLEILAFFARSPASELIVLDAVCDPDDCTSAALAIRAAMGVPAPTDSASP